MLRKRRPRPLAARGGADVPPISPPGAASPVGAQLRRLGGLQVGPRWLPAEAPGRWRGPPPVAPTAALRKGLHFALGRAAKALFAAHGAPVCGRSSEWGGVPDIAVAKGPIPALVVHPRFPQRGVPLPLVQAPRLLLHPPAQPLLVALGACAQWGQGSPALAS